MDKAYALKVAVETHEAWRGLYDKVVSGRRRGRRGQEGGEAGAERGARAVVVHGGRRKGGRRGDRFGKLAIGIGCPPLRFLTSAFSLPTCRRRATLTARLAG